MTEEQAIANHYDATHGDDHDTCDECGVDWCCGEECCEACPNAVAPRLAGLVERCRAGEVS